MAYILIYLGEQVQSNMTEDYFYFSHYQLLADNLAILGINNDIV